MAEVVVDAVETDGPRLSCTVTPSRDLRRFFTGREFYAEYDVSIDDVPEAIAAIPPLAQVCPVAWANGADVRVPVLDRRFHRSLGEVREALASMYPEFVTGGAVEAGRLVTPSTIADAGAPAERSVAGGSAAARPGDESERAETADGPTDRHDRVDGPAAGRSRSALLFSGGVDSMATYVRHREADPALVSVQGWVVDSEDETGWGRTRDRLASFADARGLDHHAIRSNMLRVLDTPMLQATYQRFFEGAWYSSVGHGLGLLGLCAPLATATDLDRLYIAATHWTGAEIRWGSCPAIDDRVAWTGTAASHDGYELTRQERVELIADYVREGHPDLQLRTCNEVPAGNCGRCEKCARTVVGLLLAGLDPTDHGYPDPAETDLFAHVRNRLEAGDWVLSRDELLMWRDLREHAPADPTAGVAADGASGAGSAPTAGRRYDPAFVAFLAWLSDVDLAAAVARAERPLRDRLVQAVARHTPYPVYERVYSVYEAVRAAGSTTRPAG